MILPKAFLPPVPVDPYEVARSRQELPITPKEDLEFRQKLFRQNAAFYRTKAYEMECEASRFDDLADEIEQIRQYRGS